VGSFGRRAGIMRVRAGYCLHYGNRSNSCLYDGEKIIGNVANLGWILADEGSGANIGRKFLVDYLREVMPENLRKQFHDRFPLSREEFLEKVYQQNVQALFSQASQNSFFNILRTLLLQNSSTTAFQSSMRIM
jgi:hypothetical protein